MEKTRWGYSTILDGISNKAYDGTCGLIKMLFIESGKSIRLQRHKFRSEKWIILSGKGHLILNDEETDVQKDDYVQISIGDKHKITAITDLYILEYQCGTVLSESDIEVFE